MNQTLDGETIYTVYGLDGTLYHRENATTGETTDYVRMGAHSVGRMDQTGAFTWTHSDHLGSASAATNSAGDIIWRESYTPFGEAIEDPAANRDEAGFTGHIRHHGTGLTYAQARYYNPVTARFLSPDPVGFADEGPGYFSRYAYTMNDPVNLVDPDGRVAHPPYQNPNFTQDAVRNGWMNQEQADQFDRQQTAAGFLILGLASLTVPDPSDLAAASASARLIRLYGRTARQARPTAGRGSGRRGVYRTLENDTGASNREFADDVFDSVVGDISSSPTRGGGRTANLGGRRQITIRDDSGGGTTMGVHVNRAETGSRIRRTREIKIRIEEPD